MLFLNFYNLLISGIDVPINEKFSGSFTLALVKRIDLLLLGFMIDESQQKTCWKLNQTLSKCMQVYMPKLRWYLVQ